MIQELIEITQEGQLKLHFHKGQWQAWNSRRRIIGVIAGTQSGKTTFGPHWLYREIQQKGPGDYLVVTPTFPLLELKALPEFRKLFEDILQLGSYKATPARIFSFSESGQLRTFSKSGYDFKTNVFFGYAAEPESLESATAKAAWLDEAGQKRFKVDSWDAIMRRLSIHRGRVLITTTPYTLGWLKQRVWDKWKAGDKGIDVIRFESIQNPMFPKEEWEDARGRLPRWKFDMFYRALFTRPAGLIYDNFNEALHKCPRFPIPDDWPRFLGLDFGGVNTAGVFYAQMPDSDKLYAYREYKAGSRSAKEHAQALLKGEKGIPLCVGGAKSEGQWRREFAQGGLPVKPPVVTAVEVGIDRVYEAHSRNQIIVFDDLQGYLDDKMSYSRELDANGEPTEKIEDKETFHFCFRAGTLVTTDLGDIPIESVRPGAMVLTRHGYRRVRLAGNKRRAMSTITAIFSDGSSISGTPDHPIFTTNRGWISLDTIRYGDIILRKENNQWLNQKEENLAGSLTIVTRNQNDGLTEITLNERGNIYIGLFGNFIMALFQMIIIFIMSIRIRAIIALRILSLWLLAIISLLSIPQSTRKGLSFLINSVGQELQDGTNQMRDGSGIGNMLKNSGKIQSLRSTLVSNAGYLTPVISLEEDQTFVAMPVNLPGDGNRVRAIWKWYVKNVGKPLWPINMQNENTVPVSVITTVENRFPVDVYNLSVEDIHEYYANGILVSNCDAERYIISFIRQHRPKARSYQG